MIDHKLISHSHFDFTLSSFSFYNPISHPTSNLPRRVKIHQCLFQTLTHRLLSLPDPNPWIVILLIGFILPIRVTNLFHDIILLLQDIVSDTGEVGVLKVGIEVHLYNAITDGFFEFVFGGAAAAVENEEDGFGLLG